MMFPKDHVLVFEKIMAGAKEVHFRSASPVVVEESYFGVNIDPNNKLMGSYMTVEEIRKAIGATTLDYLSLKNLKKIFLIEIFGYGVVSLGKKF